MYIIVLFYSNENGAITLTTFLFISFDFGVKTHYRFCTIHPFTV